MSELYAKGLCYCSVCTELQTPEEVEQWVNANNPTGTKYKWKISKDNFKDGKSNPCQCEQKSTHKHYLLVC